MSLTAARARASNASRGGLSAVKTGALGFALAVAVAAATTFASTSTAFAGTVERPKAPNALHSVWVFQTVCVNPMPSTSALEKMAKQFGFKPVTGKALQGFAPQAKPEYLKAWAFPDHARVFRVAVAISAVDAELGKNFPAYAKGKATGCTVVLPAKDKPAMVTAGMQQLLERKPDETYPAGPFKVNVWINEARGNVLLVYHYAPANGKPGGLISLVTLTK
ncbi:MAG: hypothetical protein AAFR04_15615 [Pseudomonadota bacterium]